MCSRHRHRRPAAWLLFAVAATGLLAALALPFAPVHVERTSLTWPAPGRAVESSTAQIVPYRPAALAATVPCSVVDAAIARQAPTTVLATAPDAEGLVLRTQDGRLRILPGDRVLTLDRSRPVCALTLRADPGGIVVGGATAPVLVDAPVPKLFGFRTALAPDDAAGMSVSAQVDTPFATGPTALKLALTGVALAMAAAGTVLLHRSSPTSEKHPIPGRRPRWRALAVDAAVLTTLCGWAVIGPLAVDDGWATTIARSFAETGEAGNYYRWWNASESPFALSQQLLAPLTGVTLAPLWLRLPSTALGIITWFALSRGLLGAAVPVVAGLLRVRIIAATALLAAWLPFNLGTRPESYVACGLVVVVALLWRARTPAGAGWAVLAAACVVPVSPSAAMLAAPAAVFAPQVATALRAAAPSRAHLAGLIAVLGSVGAVAIVLIFADQTFDGVRTATVWHNEFGPSLRWHDEPDRYRYLLGEGQQGSAAKRLPVLLTVTLLVPVVALAARRTRRRGVAGSALRMAAVVVPALLLLALTPSKWSYHLGAAAGLFAAFLTIGVVALLHLVSTRIDRVDTVIALGGGALVAGAAALAFAGPNAWWLPALYDLPWADGPVRPFGVPLDSWWFWLAVLAAATVAWRRRPSAAAIGPAAVAVLAAGLSVAVLLTSFTAAPLRRPEGSLARADAGRLVGGSPCGLADDVEVLDDGAPLAAVDTTAVARGFLPLAGFDPDAPPPDAPGTGSSAYVWGSRGSAGPAELTSPWFALTPGTSVAVSVTGEADQVRLEFGRADATSVTPLGDRTPTGPVFGEDNSPLPAWWSVGLDGPQLPDGADRVRVRVADDDPDSWVAVTGPRTRHVVPLSEFLAGRSPVLVAWPLGFVFPCIRDTSRIAAGVVSVPRVVIKSPGPWFTEPTDQALGGSFAALVPYGRLYEVPSRLAGHPDVDWGGVLVSADTTAHDTYRREATTVTRWGNRVMD